MEVKLVRVTEEPKMAMAQAGANCYDSIPIKGIVDHCYKSGHHSVMEFAEFHFHVEGFSRISSQQVTRHRLASIAQRSQRYCTEDGFKYIIPKSIGKNRNLTYEYMKLMRSIQDTYDLFIEAGVPPEDARFVIPNAIETVFDIKMNFRELMHFCNERLCSKAQWEIRELAQKMKDCVIYKYPELGKFLVPKCEIHHPYDMCCEEKSCGKHPKIEDVYKFYRV